jgi:hypothetical protein
LALAGKAQILAESFRAVRPGGTVAIIGRDPWAWAEHVGPIRADLATGRPLSSQTWTQLLTEQGGEIGSIVMAPRRAGLEPDSGADPVLAENLRRLADAVFRAPSFVVVATVPSR